MDIDDRIRRGIRIAGWAIFFLFLSPVLIAVAVRNLPPNAARQAALERLRQPTPPVRGRDGSDALWLLAYDVPAAQQGETAAQLRRYLQAHDQLLVEGREAKADRLEDPRTRLKAFPKLEGDPDWLCPSHGLGCLAAVGKDLQAAAAAVQVHAAALDALARLSTFDGTRYGLPPSVSQELPPWGKLEPLLRTRHALDFVQGRQAEAIAGACRELAGWRRLGADTDMLLAGMVFSAYAKRDLQLLSEMLAQLPPDAPLPPECGAALATTRAAELDLCPAMRMEFRAAEALFEKDMYADSTPGGRAFVKMAVGGDHVVAVIAPMYAAYCEEPMRKAAAMDLPADSTHPAQAKCGVPDKIGNPIGCVLVDASANAYSRYQDRRTDLAAELALMRALLWTRAHGSGSQAGFDRRPPALGLRRRAQVSADGREVSIPLFDQRPDERFALQLAAPAPR